MTTRKANAKAKRAAWAAPVANGQERGKLTAKVGGVLLPEAFPLLGQVVAAEDGGDRANGNTRAAVDALDGVDEELIVGISTGLVGLGVDTVYGASVHTSPIFSANTWFRDYIRHLNFSLILL
jgi:hypothetical protein